MCWSLGYDTERQKQVLKKIFTKEPVLTVLDLDKKKRMEVNMSDYTTEGVLFIECENEQ